MLHTDATDATDATVTNTPGEVLPYLLIWISPAISVTSVINVIFVINVRNTDTTQFSFQDYSYLFAICSVCVSYLK